MKQLLTFCEALEPQGESLIRGNATMGHSLLEGLLFPNAEYWRGRDLGEKNEDT